MPAEIPENTLEELGRCIDTITNLKFSLQLKIDPAIHVTAMNGALDDLGGKLRQIYFNLGGEDVWME